MRHLATVLKVLKDNHYVANENKCSFGKSKVEYLGHIVSKEGVVVDPKKVSSVRMAYPSQCQRSKGIFRIDGLLSEIH